MQRYKESILYIIFILIGFVYLTMQIQPQIINIFNIEKDIKTKTVEIADLERKLETLKASEIEKVNLSGESKKIYKPEESGLDAETSFTIIFDDIIEMAKYNGIKVYSVEYVYNPPEDEFVKGAADKYNVCQLNMQVIADYLDLESFIKEFYKYPYLINLNNMELSPYPKNKKILLTKLQIKLYSQK